MTIHRFSRNQWLIAVIITVNVLMSFVLSFQQTEARAQSKTPEVITPPNRLPLAFVPNFGQFAQGVEMQANGLGGTLAFQNRTLVLTFPPHANEQPTSIQLHWEGANSQTIIRGSDRLPGVYNSYIGDEKGWKSRIPTHATLTYHNLYPGIDLRYDGKDGALKGTYTVAPGADPAQIRWHYQGVRATTLATESGNLNIQLKDGSTLTEHAPIAWQESANKRTAVSARFVVEQNAVHFALGHYDPTQPLIIDPTLDYSTFLGGNSTDSGNALAIDSAGNVVVTGQSYSSNFPGAPGSRQGSTDFFVSKLNAQGNTLLYTTMIGGGDDEQSHGLAMDKQGNVWVTGETESSDFPADALNYTYRGNGDTFVAKLNPEGQLLRSGYLGLSVHDLGYAIAVDGQGNSYVTGEVAANYGPETFVKKIKADMSEVLYYAYFGVAKRGFDKGTSVRAITVDKDGSAYLTGRTNARFSETDEGGYQPFCNEFDGLDCTFDDAFVVKLNAAGNAIPYFTYLGGNGNDIGTDIAVDSSGNVLVTGYTFAANFPTKNAMQSNKRGADNFTEAFVTKLNPELNTLVYSTYLGGTYWDEGHGLAVDKQGNAFVVGMTNSPDDFPISSGAPQPTLGNGICLGSTDRYCYDGFASKLSPTGTLLWSTYLGGTDDDLANDVAVDGNGNIYITGDTESNNFPTVAGGFQINKGLQKDAFLVKISEKSSATATPTPITPTPITSTPTTQPTAIATPVLQTPESTSAAKIFLPLVQR